MGRRSQQGRLVMARSACHAARPADDGKGQDSMADPPWPEQLALLHELAERLQTTGNYLGAARRIRAAGGSGDAADSDVISKAADHLARAQSLFHQLRGELAACLAEAASSREE